MAAMRTKGSRRQPNNILCQTIVGISYMSKRKEGEFPETKDKVLVALTTLYWAGLPPSIISRFISKQKRKMQTKTINRDGQMRFFFYFQHRTESHETNHMSLLISLLIPIQDIQYI